MTPEEIDHIATRVTSAAKTAIRAMIEQRAVEAERLFANQISMLQQRIRELENDVGELRKKQ